MPNFSLLYEGKSWDLLPGRRYQEPFFHKEQFSVLGVTTIEALGAPFFLGTPRTDYAVLSAWLKVMCVGPEGADAARPPT